jgi:hypothetical protein
MHGWSAQWAKKPPEILPLGWELEEIVFKNFR